MVFSINFNEEKNQVLKAIRGVGFDDVVEAIENDKILADKLHPNPKFKHQRIYAVEIGDYVYAVPYVVNEQKEEIFLKTIYPSRVLNKKYLRKGKNEKTTR